MLVFKVLSVNRRKRSCPTESPDIQPKRRRVIPDDPVQMTRLSFDFDVAPQDDFFDFVNQANLDRLSIPDHCVEYGIDSLVQERIHRELYDLLQDLLKREPQNDREQLVHTFVTSITDMVTRNESGIEPLKDILYRISRLERGASLARCIAYLHRRQITAFFDTDVECNQKETYMLTMSQDGLGLPTRKYYIDDAYQDVRDRYQTHLKTLFLKLGRNKRDATQAARNVLYIETRLAKAMLTPIEEDDPELTHNPVLVTDCVSSHRFRLQNRFMNADWRAYFTELGAMERFNITTLSKVTVDSTRYFNEVSSILNQTGLQTIKDYLVWQSMSQLSPYLSTEYRDHHRAFFDQDLLGITQEKPLWQTVVELTNDVFGESLSKFYIETHFQETTRTSVSAMCERLKRAFQHRIQGLDWMESDTKIMAQAKLLEMKAKIGYPSDWTDCDGLTLYSDDPLATHVLKTMQDDFDQIIDTINTSRDKDIWDMLPQEVNAYYDQELNEIVLPAGYMRVPFFDPNGDQAINYGAFGATIGHEMTHGFDASGRKYDSAGRIHNWWKGSDLERFNVSCQHLVQQFNAASTEEVPVQGDLTLDENIADLGGLSIAYEAFKTLLSEPNHGVAETLDGYTAEQRFFLAFAWGSQTKVRPQYAKLNGETDCHAPAKLRVNIPLSNFTPFLEAFNVQPGQGMYRAPEERIRIW